MAFKLLYTDPKKKKLQKIEVILMGVLLPVGLFYGGRSLAELQRFKEAEALHEQAAEFCHAGNYDQGIPTLQAALEIYPEYYAVWEELGVSYHMLGQHEKEAETYLAATQALPENGSLHRELATAYHELEKHDKELESAQLAANLPNSDPLFTSRVLERAQKEASGDYKTQELERPHTHEVQDAHHDHEHESETAQAKPQEQPATLTEAGLPQSPPVD